MHNGDYALISECAGNVVEYFSELHPDIKMNLLQWSDLREMIEQEFASGANAYGNGGAKRLCEAYKARVSARGKFSFG